MGGWLIDGTWIAATEIAAVSYLVLSTANRWVPAKSLEQFRSVGEAQRAIQYILKNGKEILIERPTSIKREDLARLMN